MQVFTIKTTGNQSTKNGSLTIELEETQFLFVDHEIATAQLAMCNEGTCLLNHDVQTRTNVTSHVPRYFCLSWKVCLYLYRIEQERHYLNT